MQGSNAKIAAKIDFLKDPTRDINNILLFMYLDLILHNSTPISSFNTLIVTQNQQVGDSRTQPNCTETIGALVY